MNSVARLKWLGGTEAFRTRGLNVGDNGMFDSEMWAQLHHRNDNVVVIDKIGAAILAPYMKNLCVYNMAKAKAVLPENEEGLSVTSDFRNRFEIPVGWMLGWEYYTYNKISQNLDIIGSRHVGDITFPSGEYVNSAELPPNPSNSDTANATHAYETWRDWFFQPMSCYAKTRPIGMTDDVSPRFNISQHMWRNQKLIALHQTTNKIDVFTNKGPYVPRSQYIEGVIRWFIRSWDDEAPVESIEKEWEFTGEGQTNYLNEDQGIFLAMYRKNTIATETLNKIRDRMTEFTLHWDVPGAGVRHVLNFVFNIDYKLIVEFSSEQTGTDSEVDKHYLFEKISIAVPFDGTAVHDDLFGLGIHFIDGRILLTNVSNEVMAVINAPIQITRIKRDIQDKVYASITGADTRMKFATYGACGVIIRPILYNFMGQITSPEFRPGEKETVCTTDFNAIINEHMSLDNLVIETDFGPDYTDPENGTEPALQSSMERQEAFYRYIIYMYGGDTAQPGVDYFLSDVDEHTGYDLLSLYTPILFNVKVTAAPVPLPANLDVIPDSSVTNTEIMSLEYRKSVDDSGEYSPSSLDISFHKYGGFSLKKPVNAPFILSLGGQDSIVHDYTTDHRGNHAAGSAYVDTNITEVGTFLIERFAETRTSSDYGDRRIVLSCLDITKKLMNAVFTKKTPFDGLLHTDAIKDLTRIAFIEQRLKISNPSLIIAANDPVLPISQNGSNAQWVAAVGDSVWDWMCKIRAFSGWLLYIDRFGQIIYDYYDRTTLNKAVLLSKVKYIFTDKYNWFDLDVRFKVFESAGKLTAIPMAELSTVETDNYRTRIAVSGLNSQPKASIVDVQSGPLYARVGDRITYIYIDKELEEKLGETRIAAVENKMLSTPNGLRKVARSIAKVAFRQKTIKAFRVDVGELILDLDLYDPILIYDSDTKQTDLYEVSSIQFSVSKQQIVTNIEARTYPI